MQRVADLHMLSLENNNTAILEPHDQGACAQPLPILCKLIGEQVVTFSRNKTFQEGKIPV